MGLRKCKVLKFGGLGQSVPMIVLTYVLTMEPGGPLPLSDCVLPAITVEISPSLTHPPEILTETGQVTIDRHRA